MSYGKIQSAKAKSFVYTKSRQYWIELYTKLSRKAYTKYVTCFNAALFALKNIEFKPYKTFKNKMFSNFVKIV